MEQESHQARVRLLTIIPISISSLLAAKKQRFVDTMKMLLDIAKESADALPPLKSCLGGISALIKHYDVGFYRVTTRLRSRIRVGKQGYQ